MKRILEYILPVWDNAIGHWRFRNDLTDLSGNNHTFTGTGIASDNYTTGKTEEGLTAIDLDGAAEKISIPAPSAGPFDMGVSNFTVEVILKTSEASGTIIAKFFSSEGITMGWELIVSGGKPQAYVSDGTATACLGNTTISDGRWHHIGIAVNRITDQLRMFIDGVEDTASPFSIAARTGNFTSDSSDLIVGDYLSCQIDEATVIGEALTPTAIANRVSGILREADPVNDDFIVPFLPRANQGNAALKAFLIPFSRLYAEIILQAEDIRALARWDECHQAFLTHLASTLGFELIDLPYATEAERRACLVAAVSLYRKKGTLEAIETLIELLGCSCDLTETYSLDFPFIANFHRMWSREAAGTTVFEDDFSEQNLSQWLQALNLTSWWRTYYNPTLDQYCLIGTGNGADDDSNGLPFLNAEETYRFEIDYEITAGHVKPGEMGLFLRYVDSNNWIKLEYQIYDYVGATLERLAVVKKIGGAETTPIARVFDTAVIAPGVGRHKLWVFIEHVDAATDAISAGVDDTTMIFDEDITITGVANGKKGLFVNRAMTAYFYDVLIETIDRHAIAKAFDPAFSYRELHIDLLAPGDTPPGKVVYFQRVVPKYVSAGVNVTWTN
jgi:hypothetical protein